MTKTQLLRPLAAIGAGLVLAVGGAVVTTGPAAADTPGCLTRTEYSKVHKGMKKARVHRIFDMHGQFADGGAGGYARWYVHCRGPAAAATIVYTDGPRKPARVYSKRWVSIEG